MSPLRLYYDPATELDRLFEGAFGGRFSRVRASPAETSSTAQRYRDVYHPRLDLRESKDANTVTATFELPGLTSENVGIDVHQNRLTVSGESSSSHSQEEGGYVVRERHSGKFSRTLQLPVGTKPEDVKAKMENGVLMVTFPKTSPEQQAQRIAIQ